MCFAKEPDMPDPAPPPEVLKQDAPEKKTANQNRSQTLSIGSKRYRTETGLGTTAKRQSLTPGPSVSI